MDIQSLTSNTSKQFAKALEMQNINALRRVEKSDLHNHSFLGGNRDYFSRHANIVVPELDHVLLSMNAMHQWVEEHFASKLPEGSIGRALTYAATFEQAKNDGVSVLEIGDDVWTQHMFGDSAENMVNALINTHQTIAPEVRFIPQIGLSRHSDINYLKEALEPCLETGFFKTIDLYGDEDGQPIENFAPLFQMAKSSGLRLKAHVGEWGSADDVWRAVEVLELDEVQHGIAAAEDFQVLALLAKQKVQCNVCPSSNVMLGRVSSYSMHPIRKMIDAGVPVTINSDDVLVFGQSVSNEYLNLFRTGMYSIEELDHIRLAGLRCS